MFGVIRRSVFVIGLFAAGCASFDAASAGKAAPGEPDDGPPLMRAEPEIRVRVGRGLTHARIEGPPELLVRPLVGQGLATLAPTPILVRGGSQILLTDADAREHQFGAGVDVEIVMPDAAAAAPAASTSRPSIRAGGEGVASIAPRIRVDGVSHDGRLTLRARSDQGPDRFDAIAVMPIESYVPGVVVREMWPKWPLEAMEIQAVCSRTYAMHEQERAVRMGRAFDVEALPEDQAYGGVTANATALAATASTRGKVITDGTRLVRAYFSSCCGGHPAGATEVWPSGEGMEFNRVSELRSSPRPHACQSATSYRWEVTRSVDDVSARLRAWGRVNKTSLGRLTRVESIEVIGRAESERATRFRVKDVSGDSFALTAEEVRNACNQDVDGRERLPREKRVLSGDLEAVVRGDTVTLAGRGNGHGAGMCQWCAKGFAEQGKTWRDMVTIFYPGAKVRNGY